MTSESPNRVLVVEDDDMIASPLVRTLQREGYAVERVTHGLAALDVVRNGGADAMLLDLGLPDIDGLEVCRRAREEGFTGGIMILTARGGELDLVVGLDVGADDYMEKPFGLSALLARMRALLRRGGATLVPGSPGDASVAPAAPPRAKVAAPPTGAEGSSAGPSEGFRVDVRGRRVWVGDTELVVTAKEFDVLAVLDAEPGAVVTRERLMDEVWDENWFGSTKTLDATIGRLRQKLEDHGAPARVVTVRSVGFRLERGPTDA
jgi:DNA-binding response OmpR family regulator